MTYSFLVVDDERLSRDYICDLVQEFEPDALINEASSVSMALQIIEKIKPDVLFLDIKMPEADGFGFLELTPYRDFELVFITAHSEYAIKAFKEGACDYLLKPIKKSDFKATLERTLTRRKNELERREYAPGGASAGYGNSRLVIQQQLGIRSININDIVYLKADNTYTTLHMTTGEKIVTSKPINHFEKTLNPDWFFRIHKSHIINLHHFKEYISKNNRWALMDNDEKLLISRYRLTEFLQKVKMIPAKR